MAEMKTLNGYEVVDEKARERLDTLVIPTKTSQLENDSQFTNKQYVDTAIETAKPDLTSYYTQAQTDAAIQTAIGNIDIPTVPTNVSAFTNDAQYTNKTYVDNAVASVDVSAQLTEYAKKTELPTKVSQLQNDAGYLTEHQSLTGYATETYVDNKVAEIDLTGYATKQEVTAVENKIPSLDGYATEQYVNDKVSEIDLTEYATKQELTAVENKIPSLTGYATEAYVDGKIAEIPGTDLSNYYNKEQTNSAISTAIAGITIPTKVSELENDSNFVTETALETKGYLTAVPAEYVTETELDQKGYLTAIPAEYVTDTELNNKGYVTADDVSTAVSNARDNFYIDASGFTTFFQNVPAPQAVIDLVTYFNQHGHACVYLKDTQDAQYYPALFANPSTDYYLLMKSGTNWNTISSGSEIKWDTISIQKNSSGTWVWQSRNTGAVTLARKSDIPSIEGSKVYHFDFSSFTANSPQAATDEMIEFAESTLAGKHSCAYVRLDSGSLAFSPTKVAVDGSSVFLYNCFSGRASWHTETTASIAFYKFNDSWMANVTDKVNYRLATTTYVNDAIAAIPGTDLSNYYTKTEIDNKGYLTAVPDTYALKTDIPDVSSFTTMAAVEAKGYLTEQSLNGYATETYVTNAINAIDIPQAKTWHSYNTVAVPDEVKTQNVYHIKFSLRWNNPEFPSTTDPEAPAYFTETFDTYSADASNGFPISISSDLVSDRYYGYSAYLKKTIAWWWHNNQLVVQNMDDSTTITSQVESVHYWY